MEVNELSKMSSYMFVELKNILNEVQITNISSGDKNNQNDNHGWIPHFIFGCAEKNQIIEFASIDASLYGKPIDIKW